MDALINPDEVTWIVDQVAITNYVSAHSKDILAAQHVRAVLCLDRELEGCPPADRGIECVRVVHLVDGANEMVVFREAVSSLEGLIGKCGRVLVHCRAGRSRSIAVVAAYLTKVRGMDADEALEFVTTRRQAAVAPELVQLVERFEE